MKTTYAEGTSVPVERSRAELDALLGKHGAGARGILIDDDRGLAIIAFQIRGLQYRMEIPLPRRDEYDPAKAPKEGRQANWKRSTNPSVLIDRIDKQWQQALRERWRAIVLLLKAKLELVKLGVSTVEKEFLADMVLPNGQTVNTSLGEVISRALAAGTMPTLALPEVT